MRGKGGCVTCALVCSLLRAGTLPGRGYAEGTGRGPSEAGKGCGLRDLPSQEARPPTALGRATPRAASSGPFKRSLFTIRRKPEPFEARAPLHPGGSTTWQLHVIGNSRGQSGGCDTDWDKMPLQSAVSGSFASVLIGNISPSPQDLLDFNRRCLARLEHSTPRSRLFSALVTR